MWRSILVGAVVICGLASLADEPKPAEKPQYERLLQGEDAKKAVELEKKIEEAEQADSYEMAIQLCEQLLDLRTKVQGSDHWQTLTARWALDRRRKVAAVPPKLLDPFVRGQVSIIVTFDKPIDISSFSTADVTFISPSGRRFQAGRVELLPGAHGGRVFRVQTAMPENGNYRMQIGPYVRDRFGNNMDQDRDGNQGEVNGDVYSTIAVNRRMPNLNTLGRQPGLPTS